ncbi:glycosyltransferase family 2 protein [Pseudoramibacter porci]|uniref:Glycosyltransferase n=1 Tax=Pseudoramibacter porci TaxID=2606631 RepID=A0A7X2NGS3_9FIRM|nr:glycosyltransferase [Pseudoramibacter porci]MSS20121.1 glycosyltransferase [Pseudoramibacter porci]
MKEPLITVIVPVYNVEKYLNDCVQSIVSQTYRNLEIILVDDGSPDNCGKICDNLAKEDSRIKVIHKKNGGLSDARNAGINIATGKYITFIDSDDFIFADMIKSFVNCAEENHADLVSAQHVRCEQDDNYKEFNFNRWSYSDVQQHVIHGNNEGMRQFLYSNDIGTAAWSKLYKRSLFKDVRYPYGKYHEDTYTTYKLVALCNTIVSLNQPLYVYRKNNASIMNEPFSDKRFNMVEGKLEQAEFIHNFYPQYSKGANKDIIYACNQCMILLSKSTGQYKEVEEKLQKLYRKYWKDYFTSKVSIKGKIVAAICAINVEMGLKILRVSL